MHWRAPVVSSTALTAILALVLGAQGSLGLALAQDLNCDDFSTQGDAQAVYNADASDPHGLDANNDGIACESLAGGGGTTSGGAAPASQSTARTGGASSLANTSAQGDVSCTNYDAWEWAQAVFESDPAGSAALDPDGNGIACEELPRGGFAPAFWTDTIPDGLEEGTILAIIDGDTFEIAINGVSNRFRLYRADTPETQNELHCGGPEAMAFADWALSFNDVPGHVFIERETETNDQYGRELGYLWFDIAGEPYLLNHVLVNNGWAEQLDYSYQKYDQEFVDATAFAEGHNLGAWELCGGFQVPMAAALTVQVPEPAPVPTAEPPPQLTGGGCDPNYTPCIPAYPPDLNCPDIGFTVQRVGGDPHGLDRDDDGWGCE